MYLAECLDDDYPGTFMYALRQVILARVGMAKMARALHLNRAGLYQALSLGGNPSFATIQGALAELGIKLDLSKKRK